MKNIFIKNIKKNSNAKRYRIMALDRAIILVTNHNNYSKISIRVFNPVSNDLLDNINKSNYYQII